MDLVTRPPSKSFKTEKTRTQKISGKYRARVREFERVQCIKSDRMRETGDSDIERGGPEIKTFGCENEMLMKQWENGIAVNKSRL